MGLTIAMGGSGEHQPRALGSTRKRLGGWARFGPCLNSPAPAHSRKAAEEDEERIKDLSQTTPEPGAGVALHGREAQVGLRSEDLLLPECVSIVRVTISTVKRTIKSQGLWELLSSSGEGKYNREGLKAVVRKK